MIEKQVPGIKFDVDRKKQKTNVIHHKIPTRQNESCCKTEKFLQGVTCNKTHTAFFRKTICAIVCYWLLRLHVIIQQEIYLQPSIKLII